MTEQTRSVILNHWAWANARRWDEFAGLLQADLLYEVPQTREYIDSGAGYLEMFSTWPGDWVAHVRQLVCDGPKAVSVIDFVVGADTLTGISIFELTDGGRIVRVTDYWPEPYEPPARSIPHMKRRPE
jgi:SnoaL-like domain